MLDLFYSKNRVFYFSFLLLLVSSLSWYKTSSAIEYYNIHAFIRVIAILLVFFLSIAIFLLNDMKVSFFSKKLQLGFFCYAISSCLASALYLSPIGVWKGFELLVVFIWSVTVLGTHKYNDLQLQNAFKVTACFLGVILVYVFIGSLLSTDYIYSLNIFGYQILKSSFPSINPNALGFYSLYFCVLLLLFDFHLEKKIVFITLIAFGLWFFLNENSRSSYVAALVGLSLMAYFQAKKKIYGLHVLFLFFLFMSIYYISENVEYFLGYILRKGQSLENLMSGSGRLELARNVMPFIHDFEPFGRGIGFTRELYESGVMRNASSHNSILDILVSGGVGGGVFVFCFVCFYMQSFFYLNKKPTKKNIVLFVMLSSFLIRGLTSSSLASFQLEIVLLFIITGGIINMKKSYPEL
ncbi:O-antigen ligase family protein [Endozoicomonas sp. 8E]|uniref:O-antigen ligase family protein n=1 Tax=Endozoicomonas sp. 8E TaxID=3035692 RepID=UPI0029391DF3|nr:O-antigen ligase family protein [Endozoicomonas sp. 8E]WOG25816.1 O-antigen ligase family protein [Endozoicomonas sp. 8E]